MKPQEILNKSIDAGITKASLPLGKMIVLGILAGAFIALAAVGANTAGSNLLLDLDTFGIGKLVTGVVFTVGLMLVVLAGGELFTGNCLMITSLLDKKIAIGPMLKNWVIVYFSNLVGALAVAFLISQSGLLDNDVVCQVTLKIASAKAALGFKEAFILGIFCNFLVCLAVWIATGADSTVGKIFGMFFPIMLFVTSGFEHSIANMYYIPAGIFAGNQVTWAGFLANIVPVTLGNIVGGAIFVGMAYWYSYGKNSNN